MVVRSLAAIALVLAAGGTSACNGSKAAQRPDAPHPDRQVDALPPPGPNMVTLLIAGTAPPDFIVYRDGAGPWLVPDLVGSTYGFSYGLRVTNDYEWMVVCLDTTGFYADMEGTTFADGAEQYGACLRNPYSPNTVSVAGQMVQPGTVWMQNTAQSTTPDWNFTLQVSPGTHNLVAEANNRMLIMRDVSVSGAMSLPTVDVDQNGVAMTPVELTVNNIGSDSLSTDLGLVFADEDAADFIGTSTTVMTPPPSLDASGELELLTVTATGPSSQLQAGKFFDNTPTTFSMMPPLTSVSYAESNGTISATWGALPTFDSLRLRVSGGANGTLVQRISVTKSWLAATGAMSLSFGPLPASYNPAWKIDLGGPYVRNLEAITSDAANNTIYYSGVPEGMNGATPRSVGVRSRIADVRALSGPRTSR